MDKLLSGPLGLLLVIAQACFFVYLMRGLFQRDTDDTIGAIFGPSGRAVRRHVRDHDGPTRKMRALLAGRRPITCWRPISIRRRAP